MKRRLNLLCAIVLIIMGWSVIETGYYMAIGVRMGLQAAQNAAVADASPADKAARAAELEKLRHLRMVSTLPSHFFRGKSDKLMRDSVYNARTRSYVPVSYVGLMLSVNTGRSLSSAILTFLLGLLIFASTVWALVLFIKLIVRINKSDIFSWRNIRRLRLVGILLLASFACGLLQQWMDLQVVRRALEIPGYDLVLGDGVGRITLLLGLCALIVAEVFAIGLKMKEEQELTI